MFKEYHYSFEEVRPTSKALAKALQLPDLNVMPDIIPLISSISGRIEHHAKITGGYTLVPCTGVDVRKGEVCSGASVLSAGRRISAYMKGAEELALFVCTAGSLFSELSHEYMDRGDLLETYIVDSLG